MSDNREYFMNLIATDPEAACDLYARMSSDNERLREELAEARETYITLFRNVKYALYVTRDIEMTVTELINNQKEEKE